MGNQIYFKIAGKKKNWSKRRTARHIFGREPSNDYFIKILFLLSKWFQTKFIKNPVIYVKKLIIMLIQFKFGHFLA